jgi:hypothetical protein
MIKHYATKTWRSAGIALDQSEWPASRTNRFNPGVRATGTHWIGGWVGLRAGLDDVENRNILPLPAFEPRPSSSYPVAIPTP